MKTSALVALAVIALGSVDGAFLRQGEGVEPGANDFHGELEAASDNDSASQGLMSNQYFTSKRHIVQKDSEVGVCHAYKCVDSLVKFFRSSDAFASSACKPNPGHMQQYKDDTGKIVCRELYHLELCTGAADGGKTTVNPNGVQCVRNSEAVPGSVLGFMKDHGCNCRLYGPAVKNAQVAGVKGSSRSEVILPFRIDGVKLKRVAVPKVQPLDLGSKEKNPKAKGTVNHGGQSPTGSTGSTGSTGGTGIAATGTVGF